MAPLQPAQADLGQVLDPFEIGHRHAARVGIHVGDDDHPLFAQDFISAKGDRSIGGLDDQGGLDAGGVVSVDHTFHRGGDQDVTRGLKQRTTVFDIGCRRIPLDCAMLDHPLPDVFDPQSGVVLQGAIAFDDSRDLATIFFRQELGGVIADIAKTLNNHALAIQITGQTSLGFVLGLTEEFAQGVLHAPSRRLDPALNTASMGGLAGDACLAVDVGCVHPHVLIRDPGHFPFPRAHVRRGHVLRRMDQVAFDQLIGKAARDGLKLVFVPDAGVDAQATLRPAKGGFHQGAFIGHQRGQRFNLVLVDGQRIADAALDRFHVFGMHRPIAREGFDLATQTHTKTDGVSRVADADFLFQSGTEVHQSHSPIEHQINGFPKARFSIPIHAIPSCQAGA